LSDRWTEPWWDDYRALLARLDDSAMPSPEQLRALLPRDTVSGAGKPLRFVAAGHLPGVSYEQHIFETGEVSTREQHWHDLFNALVWCRLPRLKAAMNALHYAHLEEQADGRRGPQRDALTLLDESGAIVVSRSRAVLEALRRRDWQHAFVDLQKSWAGDSRVVICGHALLEKLLAPYPSITAHVLLVHSESYPPNPSPDSFLRWLDQVLAEWLHDGLCRKPADLSPLPLMGIPRWWTLGAQDAAFYADRAVFRPPLEDYLPAAIHPLPPEPPSPLH